MKTIFYVAIFAFTISCGNNESTKSSEQSQSLEISKPSGGTNKPCDLISESEIKKILSIPEDAPTEIKDVVRTYPSCFYKWETVTFSEVKKVMSSEVILNYPCEMSIVVVEKANQKMFETSTKVYRDAKSIEGIGDMATWGGIMSQLTFLSNGYMIHLHVRKTRDENENREFAQKIATVIIGNL